MKTKINKENRISTVLLSYHLSPDSINKLLEIAKIIFVKNKSNLVNIGDVNQNCYFIIEGGFVARSFYFDSQKIAATNFFLHDYFPFMACVDSFFNGAITKTELIAIKNSLVLAFHKSEIEKLMVENQDILLLYLHMMSEIVRNESELKTVLIGSSKKDIYGYLIEKCNPVIKHVPGKYIAEFMGITAEWYSKLKKVK